MGDWLVSWDKVNVQGIVLAFDEISEAPQLPGLYAWYANLGLGAADLAEEKQTRSALRRQTSRDAMFRGLGIYWTLKEDYEQWLKNNQIARERSEQPHEKTETGKAWEAVLEKEREFAQERAKRLFNRKQDVSEDLLRASENTFATLRTQAFISGAVLTFASMKHDLGYDSSTFNSRVDTWIESWNLALKASSKRVRLFDRKQENAFLKLPKLESPFSVYFRYLLLELMASVDKSGLYDEEKESVKKMLYKARQLYLEELISQQEKALRRTEPTLNSRERSSKAKENGEALLRELCKTWFNIPKDEFHQWLSQAEISVPAVRQLEDDYETLEDDDYSTLEDEEEVLSEEELE